MRTKQRRWHKTCSCTGAGLAMNPNRYRFYMAVATVASGFVTAVIAAAFTASNLPNVFNEGYCP